MALAVESPTFSSSAPHQHSFSAHHFSANGQPTILSPATARTLNPLLLTTLLDPIIPESHTILVLSSHNPASQPLTQSFPATRSSSTLSTSGPSSSSPGSATLNSLGLSSSHPHRFSFQCLDPNPITPFQSSKSSTNWYLNTLDSQLLSPPTPQPQCLFSKTWALSVLRSQRSLCARAIAAARKALANDPSIKCILLDDPHLTVTSPLLRGELGVPVFDAISLIDLFLASVTANPRFGTQFQPEQDTLLHQELKDVTIGVVRIDHDYTFLPGNVTHQDSHVCRIDHRVVQQLGFEAAQQGQPLTTTQQRSLRNVVDCLIQESGASAITGDCGFLINYHKDIQQASGLPCLTSSLLQCKLLASTFSEGSILVLTSNAKSLTPQLPGILDSIGVPERDRARFVALGVEDVPGFEAVATGALMDQSALEPRMVELVLGTKERVGDVCAVLLECTEMPCFANAIRFHCNLPVLDCMTLVDFHHSAL